MKPVYKKILKSSMALLFMSTLAVGQNSVQKDIYGREIIDSNGKRINYSKDDAIPTTQNLKTATTELNSNKSQQSNVVKQTTIANVDNLYSIMGTAIGRNSMHSIDIDNDGVVELICTASSQGASDFWYMMHYNSNTASCDQIWTSPQYSKKIVTLEVVDFNNDYNYSILLGFDDGTIQIYDGKTKALTKEVKVVDEQINSIVYADADNDSIKDIVISCSSNTYILNSNTLLQKFKIAQGSKYVRVGNVDSDAKNEIVLSYGAVYRLTGSSLEYLWRFTTVTEGLLELSDIDGDLQQEIILAEPFTKISIYDVDSQTIKYTLIAEYGINSLCLKDVNNDGVDEILYGDDQWGKVYCYNAVTKAKMWEVTNPEHGVAAINYADLNNDGKQELIWSAGWTSTGADYLYIYDVSNNKLLWRSDDIVGPFYAIAKGDVDKDGKDEIVAVSYESESGYGSGILVIIDAQTNKLKWKSDGVFFKNVWTGIYAVSIKDIDNDGQNEIIVAAGQNYTGNIWIVDGKNHTVKSSHLFSSDGITEFYSLTVDDIDNDGQPELLAVSNSTLYAIRPSDWAIKWKVSITGTYYNSRPVLKCADLNGDLKKETILCSKGSIQIIDGSTQSLWFSPQVNYTNFDLFDVNEDGVLDIVGSTTDGHIIVLNGKTKAILKNLNPETTEITSVRVKKLDTSILYIYSCDGKINFYINDSSCFVTQSLGVKIGEVESFKIMDLQSDPTELLIGTAVSVLRMNTALKSLFLDTNSFNLDDAVNNKIQLYPNPSKNEVFVKTTDNSISNYSYDLINSKGQILRSNVPAQQEIEKIDVTNLSPGIYYLRLNIKNTYYFKKIIKE